MSQRLSFDVLSDGSLILTLSEGCIETTARRAHRELAAALLERPSAGPALGAMLEMVEEFLRTANFAALRAEDPQLAGHVSCRVRLYRREDGVVRWAIVEPR